MKQIKKMRTFTKNPNKVDDSDEDSDSSMDFHEAAILNGELNDTEDADSTALDDDDDDDVDDDDDDDDSDFLLDSSDDDSIDESGAAGGTSAARPGPSSSNRETLEEDDDDETIKAIKAAILKPRTTPPEIKTDDFVTDLSFHPERDIIALGTMTGDILIYKYSTTENILIKKIEAHGKACRSVKFDDDGINILSASKDKSIMITDLETEKLKQFYDNAHESPINKLYCIDENLFSTGDDAGTVKLWDKRTNVPIFNLKEVEDYISDMLTNDSKKLLLVTSGDGYLTTINLGSRKLYVQSEPYNEELTCMGLFRNDSKLVVGTNKGRMYTFNWGQFGYHSDMFPNVKTPIDYMLPITDRISCVGGEEGILRATHIAPFKILGVVGQHKLPVESIDINHSGEFIASSSHNNDVLFWNIKYFEDFNDIKYNSKHNFIKDRRHNLPSSKYSNTSDFFADLANTE